MAGRARCCAVAPRGDWAGLPGEYRRVDIPKRRGGLRRLIIPNVSDRIVHTALAEALKPVLEPMFEDASFAYRPGRSVKQAVAKIEHWRDRGYTHVIEADIVAFFDNIAHDLLLQKLRIALDDLPGSAPLLEIIWKALSVCYDLVECPSASCLVACNRSD